MTDLLIATTYVLFAGAAGFTLVGLLVGIFDFTDTALALLGAALTLAMTGFLVCLIGLTATVLT